MKFSFKLFLEIGILNYQKIVHNMKIIKKTSFLVVILFFPVLLIAQSGPKFEVTGGENINTGDHLRGQEVQYEILFKNTGDTDLKINSVSTSCGCSTALASSDLLKPGEDGTIKFTFNGNGYGQVVKNVFVTTNESPTNMHTLTMVMNMTEPLTLSPASILLEGKKGQELTQTATLKNILDKIVTITQVSSNSPAVTVTADKTELNTGETVSLNISIKIYEDSPVNAAVIITTSEGEYQIPILVDVKSD